MACGTGVMVMEGVAVNCGIVAVIVAKDACVPVGLAVAVAAAVGETVFVGVTVEVACTSPTSSTYQPLKSFAYASTESNSNLNMASWPA